MTIKVLVADDHAIIRDGLRQIFSDTEDLVVAGEARDGNEALMLVRSGSWDVAVLDISMPGRSGLELIKLIKSEQPKLPVVVFTMHSESQYAIRALRAGASAYVGKESDGDHLIAVIRKVAAGGIYLSPTLVELMAREMMPNAGKPAHLSLSDREFQIFRMIAAGDSLTDIADRLSLSIKTVSTHKTHIMQKMNFANQSELIRYAIRHQLVDESDAPEQS